MKEKLGGLLLGILLVVQYILVSMFLLLAWLILNVLIVACDLGYQIKRCARWLTKKFKELIDVLPI